VLHPEGQTVGSRIDDTTAAIPASEPRLCRHVHRDGDARGYALPQYVDLVSSNARKNYGLYPRKGALAPGSDADIAILDPTRRG